MEMEGCENSLPSLLCEEDESCLDEVFHYKDEDLRFCSVSESDSEYFELLIKKETIFPSNVNTFSDKSETSWLKCARRDAIKWILDTRTLYGFHYRTAYLTLIYFDRFLSRSPIDNGKLWAVQLLSVACLSLAAKMEERKVPALSKYNADEYWSRIPWNGNMIQRMELLVLDTLEWKMSYATPFTYLNYFTTKLCGECRHNEVINRAIELILEVMGEIDVIKHRPSIIAAAAVLAAYDHHLTKKMVEIKINVVPSWGSIEKERTLSCYSLLQEVAMLKSNIFFNLPSTPSSSIDVLDVSTIRYRVGSKRRLIYNDSDTKANNC